MRVVVTNDDGVHAPGLWALVRALSPICDIAVCAPDRDRSGVGTSLTLVGPVRAMKMFPQVDGVETYGIDGTPGDAAILGIKELADGPVDVLVSGINAGNNISFAVTMSGTVGAALHARLAGTPAIAISAHTLLDFDSPQVAEVTRAMVAAVANRTAGPPPLLNVNFPAIDPRGCADHTHTPNASPIAGVMLTTLADVDAIYEVTPEKRGLRTYFWNSFTGPNMPVTPEMDGSDLQALIHGYVSITPLNRSLGHGESTEAAEVALRSASEALANPG